MGLEKASLPFGAEAMLQRVVRRVSAAVETVVVVAAREQALPDLPAEVAVVRDERDERGPLEGLAAGLRALEGKAEAVYLTGCDVPRLVPAFVERMFEQLAGHEIAVPVDEQFQHPLAAVYRPAVLPRIEALLRGDRLRPVFLFEQADTRAVPVALLREVDPELATLDNLNRPNDYLGALRREGLDVPADVLAVLRRVGGY